MKLWFFPALLEKPQRIKFAQQEDDEHIELFLRRHFITNIPWIFLAILGFFLPMLVVYLDQVLSFNTLITVPTNFLIASLVLWYMFLVAYILENFLHWYFNIYIVTNIHVVDINFHSVLLRDILEVELKEVLNVSSEMGGIIRSLFNYGTVILKTAAEKQEVTFTEVPRPDMVADKISDLRRK